MDYEALLREAHENHGAQGLCGVVLHVMGEVANVNGQHHQPLFHQRFKELGLTGMITAFGFCNVLMGNFFQYHMAKGFNETPFRQIGWLLELCRMYEDYRTETPDKYKFLFDGVEFAMNKNIENFMDAQDWQETRTGLVGKKLAQKMIRLCNQLTEFKIEGEHVDRLKQRSMLLRLTHIS